MSQITKLREHDVICALSTPAGVSGIAVVRVSGPGSWELARTITKWGEQEIVPRQTYLRWFYDLEDGEPFDQGLIVFYQDKSSYTGQESVEFFPHGSPVIVERLLFQLCQKGARIAEPGEFTFRAFLNGRLDLVQAEGVLHVIESQSVEQAKQGLRHLRGVYSQKLSMLEQQLVRVLAHMEADIDFALENLTTASQEQLREWMTSVAVQLDEMLQGAQKGRILKEGVHVLLMGPPNSGNSTLLNNILGEEKAIVSPIAGTTRDVIEGSILIEGVRFYFYDTAGIRQNSSDEIEGVGIKKALDLTRRVDLIFLILNPHVDIHFSEFHFLTDLNVPVITLFTHRDLGERRVSTPEYSLSTHWISNLKSDEAKALVVGLLKEQFLTRCPRDLSLMVHVHQEAALQKAREHLKVAVGLMDQHVGTEIISLEVREALYCIQKVLGKHFDDDILDQIFSEFCIGK
ncbi:MAG: tRNA uridine-5-carboxymethylaminomethyl(34) synthesis GTPase MnmE [Bdellovibrionaceae bacterium]|nr:tRNA uridine-5-carboxymethylaminomethyl(34) synthesis GTPase MnmE [Pseudobdellovibrionaceae bacterium]